VIFSEPLQSAWLFRFGAVFIGFGGGLFAVSTLTTAMEMAHPPGDQPACATSGLVLGAWGAVQACAGGLAIGLGGALRDGVTALAAHGMLGEAMSGPGVGYSVVYHIEIALLFATLVALGPLVRRRVVGAAGSPPPRLGSGGSILTNLNA